MRTDLYDRLADPARLIELARYDLGSDRLRAALDEVAQRSAKLLDAPASLVSVLGADAQQIIGEYGLGDWVAVAQGAAAEWAVCSRTVLKGEPYCVADFSDDPQYAANPFLATAGLRSYFGVPLVTPGGLMLGAHCVVDTRRRIYTGVDLAVLSDSADEAMEALLRHRRP
ncbi:histidine kinase [Actinoplanes sp. SE50]|uniref:GAF domain-containing protein n=1 Tax=unclassified Actinoplanes TaxID=2626549 RepID=UPI00023EBF76|nr:MULTISPECIES: GAF domain-containing protein [unclassified Actinoplanes]AEV86297.1 putative GAF sensor protein [Actinoplanes sp. SE50/110]ATO84694.1 histidine kinase [Actinoplanes sp. SE50]SLM02104.1 histidine kinase [Actinoplanes sp. SE50/110]